MTQYKYKRIKNVTDKLFADGIVEGRWAYDVVFDMCEASFNVLQRSRSKDKDVLCQWDDRTPRGQFKYEPALYRMMKDCIKYKQELNFAIWYQLRKEYIESGCNPKLKVTWNRINDKKALGNHNYTLDNMEPKSFTKNASEGNAKPVLFFLWQRKPIKLIISGRYSTANEIKIALEESNFELNCSIDALVKKARKEGVGNWEHKGFTHKNKRYLVQMAFV